MLNTIFNGKTVLITGHTGFKGSWLSIWLNSLGAKVVGLSNGVPTQPSNYAASSVEDIVTNHVVDVRNLEEISDLFNTIQPDFIFHLAAQALVRPSYVDPVNTITTNAIGSISILEGLRSLDKSVVTIMITSDKVYDNVEWVWGYRETDRLGGKDPYSGSKGMAELAIHSYLASYFSHDSKHRIAIARAGNVIGGGDWADSRIVPDCMRAWSDNKVVDIRSPLATRPWQHVLEPLSSYLTLAANLYASSEYHGEAYKFGPANQQDHSVADLIDAMMQYWDQVKWNDVSDEGEHVHEAGLLKLNCDKALFDLNWLPTLSFSETVRMTVEWYRHYYAKSDSTEMIEFTNNQIAEYTMLANKKEIVWAR